MVKQLHKNALNYKNIKQVRLFLNENKWFYSLVTIVYELVVLIGHKLANHHKSNLTILILYVFFQKSCDTPSPIMLFGLTMTFISSYTLHMVISEYFFFNPFVFLVLKNLFGFLYLIFVPVIIITNHKAIR